MSLQCLICSVRIFHSFPSFPPPLAGLCINVSPALLKVPRGVPWPLLTLWRNVFYEYGRRKRGIQISASCFLIFWLTVDLSRLQHQIHWEQKVRLVLLFWCRKPGCDRTRARILPVAITSIVLTTPLSDLDTHIKIIHPSATVALVPSFLPVLFFAFPPSCLSDYFSSSPRQLDVRCTLQVNSSVINTCGVTNKKMPTWKHTYLQTSHWLVPGFVPQFNCLSIIPACEKRRRAGEGQSRSKYWLEQRVRLYKIRLFNLADHLFMHVALVPSKKNCPAAGQVASPLKTPKFQCSHGMVSTFRFNCRVMQSETVAWSYFLSGKTCL